MRPLDTVSPTADGAREPVKTPPGLRFLTCGSVDDERLPLKSGEKPQMLRVRFRTLGCYPLTGAIRSDADTLDAIIEEMRASTSSERQGRVIDHDGSGSMEKKKREGYF